MGLDDIKIGAVTASLFLPVIAQAVQGDMPAWVLTLKELGSVVAVIYLFYYTLTRAIPTMQQRFEETIRDMGQAQSERLRDLAQSYSDQLTAERIQSSDMNNRLLEIIHERLVKEDKKERPKDES